MPELPEVETIRRQLQRLIVGKTISSIEVLNPGSFRAEKNNFIGKSITDVGRQGKVLIIRTVLAIRQGQSLSDDKQALFVHLKMSGQLEFKAKGQGPRAKGEKHKHLRVTIGFTDNSRLLFHDQRKFGWITDNPAALPRGIDALDPALSPSKLAEILASSSRPIKQILLDQSKIAGIGNIYASEILWQAKINPATKGLTFCGYNSNLKKLHDAIKKILYEAIKYGGSTMTDNLYRRADGEIGGYQNRFRVYDRAGEPCLRCQMPIKKEIIAHRSTYFCPACQTV